MILKFGRYVGIKYFGRSSHKRCTLLTHSSSRQKYHHASMTEAYLKMKELCRSKKLPPDVNLKGVFACNELDLREISVYGFDYDYTLACYKPTMDYLLYNLAKETLVKKHKYPSGILSLEYIPGFAVRGLHYDIEKGLLLKIDSFLQIQLGSVYRGLSPVSDTEVLQLYKNKTVPLAYVEAHVRNGGSGQATKAKMVQLADLFSVPEMSLLCNVAEYFMSNGIDYHPEILFHDVKNSVRSVHPIMHSIVEKDITEYVLLDKSIRLYFERLVNGGKKLFLVTNSPYRFVDRGMSYVIGDDWREFFDVVVVQARKPRFFTDESRPMRIYDEGSQTHVWDRVTRLKKGTIYYEGTVKQLLDMTGWSGEQVLYFGDHPYSDLADVTLEHGWRTGAIISELTHEIETLNNPQLKLDLNWLQMLTQLIEDYQDTEDSESIEVLAKWLEERDDLRYSLRNYSIGVESAYSRTGVLIHSVRITPSAFKLKTKCVFNKQFGSVFRTYHNPTYFSRRLFRFADIYTSSIGNLLNYSINHTFYPRRGVMPHEYTSLFV